MTRELKIKRTFYGPWRAVCLIVLCVLLEGRSSAIKVVQNPKPVRVGDILPLPETGALRILAFMPSLSSDCDYASMLTQGFYYYFVKGLAFKDQQPPKKIQITLFVKTGLPAATASVPGRTPPSTDTMANSRINTLNWASAVQTLSALVEVHYQPNITLGMDLLMDSSDGYFRYANIKSPTTVNDATTLLLLDEHNTVVYIDTAYRAQGEHLKPLESHIMDLEGVAKPIAPTLRQDSLKVGDRAPNFDLGNGKKLSDLRGKPVLISFYPAAFSGVFAPRIRPAAFSGVFAPRIRMPNISCSVQISHLDLPKTSLPPKYYQLVVSSATSPLLDAWKAALGTGRIDYVNDLSYEISKKYNSFHEGEAPKIPGYNTRGYNNRVSFIVNRKGRIAYIDWSFEAGDEETLHEQLEALGK